MGVTRSLRAICVVGLLALSTVTPVLSHVADATPPVGSKGDSNIPTPSPDLATAGPLTLNGAASIVSDPSLAPRVSLGELPVIAGPGSAIRSLPVQVGPAYPPDPELAIPPNSGQGRRVVYSNRRQRIWVIDENEQLIKTHRISGRTGYPTVGTYSVYSRSLHTFATHNPSIIWNYMVRFATGPNGGAVGFHEIPTQCTSSGCGPVQSVEQLGQPLSGGCVRQATADAIWMWEWADIGTVVVVVDNG